MDGHTSTTTLPSVEEQDEPPTEGPEVSRPAWGTYLCQLSQRAWAGFVVWAKSSWLNKLILLLGLVVVLAGACLWVGRLGIIPMAKPVKRMVCEVSAQIVCAIFLLASVAEQPRRLWWLWQLLWYTREELRQSSFEQTFDSRFCSRGKALFIIALMNINCGCDYTTAYLMWTYTYEV